MNDDYLWDGSGEPDPEVDRLEALLGRFRYRGAAPDLPVRLRPRRRVFLGLVAAAALLFAVLTAGVWLVLHRDQTPAVTQTPIDQRPRRAEQDGSRQAERAAQKAEVEDEQLTRMISAPQPRHGTRPDRVEARPDDAKDFSIEPDELAQLPPLEASSLDPETITHLENVQLLFRSFRNARLSNGHVVADIDYEKQRSRELISTNILLRRSAEFTGSLQVAELLSSLEPFLLDIANLQDELVQDDVRSIKERMQRTEIIAALQLYTAEVSSSDF